MGCWLVAGAVVAWPWWVLLDARFTALRRLLYCCGKLNYPPEGRSCSTCDPLCVCVCSLAARARPSVRLAPNLCGLGIVWNVLERLRASMSDARSISRSSRRFPLRRESGAHRLEIGPLLLTYLFSEGTYVSMYDVSQLRGGRSQTRSHRMAASEHRFSGCSNSHRFSS